MDSLLKAAENFVDEPKTDETFDESLFVEFMRKIPIWEFFCISKQVYLNMAEKEKRDKISRYYSAMKNRHVPAGEFNLNSFCSFFLVIILSLKEFRNVSCS